MNENRRHNCTVTNKITNPIDLSQNYPRGGAFLQEALEHFSSIDTRNWFEKRGVPLKIEKDGRVFPVSDSSNDIAKCLQNECLKLGIRTLLKVRLKNLTPINNQWKLNINQEEIIADKVILATGGNKAIWEVLSTLDVQIIEPVPSLFTFKLKENPFYALSGISLENVTITDPSSKKLQNGPILLTHEGISGPVVLRTSAWSAFELSKKNYETTLEINWLPNISNLEMTEIFMSNLQSGSKEAVANYFLSQLPKRLGQHILEKSSITHKTNFAELGKKRMQIVLRNLFSYPIEMIGKSTFKEEFVTAGGVDLNEIIPLTFELKKHPNLYIIGEALNIDAITGGFNFQAAWTGGFLVGRALII
jgi:predicted Rossmann fold flavoprotein